MSDYKQELGPLTGPQQGGKIHKVMESRLPPSPAGKGIQVEMKLINIAMEKCATSRAPECENRRLRPSPFLAQFVPPPGRPQGFLPLCPSATLSHSLTTLHCTCLPTQQPPEGNTHLCLDPQHTASTSYMSVYLQEIPYAILCERWCWQVPFSRLRSENLKKANDCLKDTRTVSGRSHSECLSFNCSLFHCCVWGLADS